VRVQELEERVAIKYPGGKGMRAYLLYEHLKPETHPFEPENILIFMTGPLTRTTFPSVSKLYVMPPFPPPGTFLDSYPGGFFGT